MQIDQIQNAYLGDIVGGLSREAAMHKARASAFEAQVHALTVEVERLKSLLPPEAREPEPYISGDHLK